ncbi:MAG TPA: hypothetical protein VLE95_01315 [Chlamydiales bacterium]|nr:hypothetical protein [Chlamydiales bacterium]
MFFTKWVYRNNLKNREFDKEAALVFASGASDHCLWQGASTPKKMLPSRRRQKTDSSGCFGINRIDFSRKCLKMNNQNGYP